MPSFSVVLCVCIACCQHLLHDLVGNHWWDSNSEHRVGVAFKLSNKHLRNLWFENRGHRRLSRVVPKASTFILNRPPGTVLGSAYTTGAVVSISAVIFHREIAAWTKMGNISMMSNPIHFLLHLVLNISHWLWTCDEQWCKCGHAGWLDAKLFVNACDNQSYYAVR